jgi:hypothetical protein
MVKAKAIAKGFGIGLSKSVLKIILKAIGLPFVVAYDVAEVAVCVTKGDYVGAGLNVVYGIVDVVTCGTASAVKETA